MKDTILILLLVWSLSTAIMKRQIFEEGISKKMTILRLVFSPLLLGFEIIGWIIFSSKGN